MLEDIEEALVTYSKFGLAGLRRAVDRTIGVVVVYGQTASQHCLLWCGIKPARGSRVTLIYKHFPSLALEAGMLPPPTMVAL
jgi:hypothetical protein